MQAAATALKRVQRKMERSMIGIILKDKVRNENALDKQKLQKLRVKLPKQNGVGRKTWRE